MPELIEVEAYRRATASLVGRTVTRVIADPTYVRGKVTGRGIDRRLRHRTITGTDRHGKLLLVRFDQGPDLGLRFGMTGRLVVDGAAVIERLEYGPAGVRPQWVHFEVRTDGGDLVVVDPRRLGWVELDPDRSRLGPDATTVTLEQLSVALAGSAAPLKARLLDQSRLAGIGNLLADETLWHVGIAPTRPGGSLDRDEVAALRRELRATIRRLTRRGGSHTGDLQPARVRGAWCPRCGTPLRREAVAGRTTYWCPNHQR